MKIYVLLFYTLDEEMELRAGKRELKLQRSDRADVMVGIITAG